jgi:hypothetical protein
MRVARLHSAGWPTGCAGPTHPLADAAQGRRAARPRGSSACFLMARRPPRLGPRATARPRRSVHPRFHLDHTPPTHRAERCGNAASGAWARLRLFAHESVRTWPCGPEPRPERAQQRQALVSTARRRLRSTCAGYWFMSDLRSDTSSSSRSTQERNGRSDAIAQRNPTDEEGKHRIFLASRTETRVVAVVRHKLNSNNLGVPGGKCCADAVRGAGLSARIGAAVVEMHDVITGSTSEPLGRNEWMDWLTVLWHVWNSWLANPQNPAWRWFSCLARQRCRQPSNWPPTQRRRRQRARQSTARLFGCASGPSRPPHAGDEALLRASQRWLPRVRVPLDTFELPARPTPACVSLALVPARPSLVRSLQYVADPAHGQRTLRPRVAYLPSRWPCARTRGADGSPFRSVGATRDSALP